MSRPQSFGRQNCVLLAVLCGQFAQKPRGEAQIQPPYTFPQLVSSGRLDVQTLINPTVDRFCEAQKLVQPNILYFQGEQLENDEQIGSLVWGAGDVSDPEMLSSLVGPTLPTIVYLEIPSGEKIAQAFHSKGVPYVIYCKSAFSSYAASHFRQGLLSVVQSSCSHTWDAFQLAHSSYMLYCTWNNQFVPGSNQKLSSKLGPHLLGDSPKINIPLPEKDLGEGAEVSNGSLSSLKIFDEVVDLRFLVCGLSCTLDACLLGSLEDGLNALLNIEVRGSKLHNRVRTMQRQMDWTTFAHPVAWQTTRNHKKWSVQVPAHSYLENGDGIVVLAMASTFPSIPSRALVLQLLRTCSGSITSKDAIQEMLEQATHISSSFGQTNESDSEN